MIAMLTYLQQPPIDRSCPRLGYFRRLLGGLGVLKKEPACEWKSEVAGSKMRLRATYVDGGVNVVEKRRFENPVTVKQLCNFIWRNGIYQHGGKPLGGRQGMGFVSDQSRPVPFHHSRLPEPGGGHP
jgi:hypothetical protein